MATAHELDRTEQTTTDFYLPGTSISSVYDRIGDAVGRLFGRHGVVPIPDSYNK